MAQRDQPSSGDASPQLPEGRYAKSTDNAGLVSSRVMAIILVVLALALVVALGSYIYEQFTAEKIEGEVTSAQVIDDNSVSATASITRSDPDREAICIFRSREYSGAEVGRAEVYLAPGEEVTNATAEFNTTARAYVSELYGCTYDVPPYLDRDASSSE